MPTIKTRVSVIILMSIVVLNLIMENPSILYNELENDLDFTDFTFGITDSLGAAQRKTVF